MGRGAPRHTPARRGLATAKGTQHTARARAALPVPSGLDSSLWLLTSIHSSLHSPIFHAFLPCFPFFLPSPLLLASLSFLPRYEISQGEAAFPKGRCQPALNLIRTMDFSIK